MSDPWSGILGAFTGAAAGMQNQAQAMQNYQLQSAAFDWMKGAQEKTWEREDTAVQRRMADLKAAGLNPVLAAGASAQTGSPVRLEAPQMRADPFGAAASAATAVQSMHQSAAQVDLLRQNAAKAAEERKGVALDNDWKERTLGARTDQEAAKAEYAVKTLADRIDQVTSEKDLAYWNATIASINESVLAWEPAKGDPATMAGIMAKVKTDLLAAQKAATDAGVDYTKGQLAALAFAIKASGMNADWLKSLGVAPAQVDFILRIADVAATFFGSAVGAAAR